MFVSNASETRVTVEKRLRIEIEKWVAGRQADLGLTLFPVESTAVEAQPITTFASVAILPASHRLATGRTLSPKELDGEPIILPKQSARLRQLADPAFLQTDVRIPPFFETSGAIASCHIRRRLGNRHKRTRSALPGYREVGPGSAVGTRSKVDLRRPVAERTKTLGTFPEANRNPESYCRTDHAGHACRQAAATRLALNCVVA